MHVICQALLVVVLVVGGAHADGCFHGSTIVETLQYGRMRIDKLAERPDAKVLSATRAGKLLYSPIKYWLHADADTEIGYLEIQAASGHTPLSITRDHLMYIVENATRKVIRAGELHVGDQILVVSPRSEVVTSNVVAIRETTKRGIYAPITRAGPIVVNDVVASSYVAFKNEYVQELVLDGAFKLRGFIELVLPSSWIVGAPLVSNRNMDVPQLALLLLDVAQSFFEGR